MRSMITLIKKELLENVRTGKFLILAAVFVLIALGSPVLAKFTPELLKMAMESSSGGMGIQVTLPEPTTIHSYLQFFGNFGQMAYIALILIVMGAVSDEKARGTIVLVLTKNVTRTQLLISKFTSQLLIFTACYITAVGGFMLYTYVLFNKVLISNAMFSLSYYWLGGVLLLSLTLLASTLSKTVTTSAVLSLAAYALTGIVPSIPYIGKYMPSYITSAGAVAELLGGTKSPNDFVIPLIATVVCIIAGIALSTTLLKRQEI